MSLITLSFILLLLLSGLRKQHVPSGIFVLRSADGKMIKDVLSL